MSQKKLLAIVGFALIVATFFLLVKTKPTGELPVPSPAAQNQRNPRVIIGDTTYIVEIADTPALQAQGLSDRPDLAQNAGMLFVFNQKGKQQFWMKDMHFPLDFVWIEGTTIVDLTQNVPPPAWNELNLPIYQPKVDVDKVLEINAGEIAKHGFTIGQNVDILQDSAK